MDESWSSTVVGMVKRDLLRDVLSVFGMFYVLHGSRHEFT